MSDHFDIIYISLIYPSCRSNFQMIFKDSISNERLILIFTDIRMYSFIFSYFNELESLKSER